MVERVDSAVDAETATDHPLITVVIPTLDEATFIETCLSSLLDQRGVPGEIEVLVVDGGSTDGTVERVRALEERDSRVRLIDNPDRIQTAAFNLGMREARGEYIAFVGAHATYDRGYLASCLEVLRRTEATNVGAVQTPVGRSSTGRAIAWAMSSRWGVGGASFRYAKEETHVRSVFGGFMRLEDLRELEGFREEYRANEDYDLNCRIRETGGSVVVSPSIRCEYYVRESLPGIARQMFRYGKWRVKTVTDHPQSLMVRHIAASWLPLILAGCLLLMPVVSWGWMLLSLPAVYVLALFGSVVAALGTTGNMAVALKAPVVLATMHLSWGIGWWAGVRRFGFPWAAAENAIMRFVRSIFPDVTRRNG